MATVTVQTSGNLFDNPGKRVTKAIDKGLVESSKSVVSIYQKDTPVRTGFLRSQWIYKVSKNTSTIYNDANYAKYVFRRRATLDRNERVAGKQVAESINKSIEEALN